MVWQEGDRAKVLDVESSPSFNIGELCARRHAAP